MGDGLKPAFQPLTKHPKSMSVRVGILGASDHPDRYAYLAALELMDHGFDILPINPTKEEILGKPVLKSLLDTDLALHTLTIYVQPSRLKEHLEAILQKRPKRIVFNPGRGSGTVSYPGGSGHPGELHRCAAPARLVDPTHPPSAEAISA